jgi:hypothetical protein
VNEPWLKYSMAAVADRGLKPNQWTSARLHNDVLYLETQRCARAFGGRAWQRTQTLPDRQTDGCGSDVGTGSCGQRSRADRHLRAARP